MKKTGILKAMKLCMDYEKMSAEEKEKIRRKRLEEIVYEAEREANPEAFAVNPEDDVCIFKDLPLEDEDPKL